MDYRKVDFFQHGDFSIMVYSARFGCFSKGTMLKYLRVYLAIFIPVFGIQIQEKAVDDF